MAGYIVDGIVDLFDHTVLEVCGLSATYICSLLFLSKVGAGTGLPGILSVLKGARMVS